MDRREIVRVFRERLSQVIAESGASRSSFAAAVGLDRSTLSQLMAPDQDRLPRAETIARIAASAQVSVDWLLGLSQVGQLGTDVVSQALEIEPGAGSPADERLQRWHAEAAGYKIRYVPSTVPDLLKTEAVIHYEYAEYGGHVPQTRVQVAEQRLAYSRRPETDIEVCSSFQSVEELARGEGIWRLLPLRERKAQIRAMIELLEELYPTLRWFLFDGLRQYCVPLTIFGPLRAAVYVGDMYFVFNSTEHVRVLTRHFDDLIRVATVQPPDVPDLLRGLLESVEDVDLSKALRSGRPA